MRVYLDMSEDELKVVRAALVVKGHESANLYVGVTCSKAADQLDAQIYLRGPIKVI